MRSTMLKVRCCSLLLILLQLSVNVRAQTKLQRRNRSQQLLASIGVRPEHYNSRKLYRNTLPQYTDIDRDYRQLLLSTRRLSLNWALRSENELIARNRREGKMQPIIPKSQPFACALNNTRSSSRPTSVERLRPGDIDVIAAFGDSVSAGNGIISHNALDMVNEWRGMTFSGGGMADWRRYLTLPNILKVFNPQLYGYAIANDLVVNHRTSRLSIAEPMIMSHDLPYQARVFIDLLQRDAHVDMQRHWKLLTIYVGNNDICSDMCHWTNSAALLAQHAKDLRQAFRLLRDNVPRLLINLIVVPNIVRVLSGLHQVPWQCYMVHRIACNCLMSDQLSRQQLQQRQQLLLQWQQIDLQVARSPEFQRKDFAIVAHPMIANMSTPLLPNGDMDWRPFGHDCFHFSQRAHAVFANLLWNSMWLPDERKPQPQHMPDDPFEHFECPSAQRPYFLVRPS
ncbi:CG11029, partial [Drosophila busckii]